MVGRENKDIKKDERDNWTVAAVSLKRILLPVTRKHSPNLLIDFLNDVKSLYRWTCSVFITDLAVFILIQELMFPCTVPLNTWMNQVFCSEFSCAVTFRFYAILPAISAICSTVDHLLTGRSHIGRAPPRLLFVYTQRGRLILESRLGQKFLVQNADTMQKQLKYRCFRRMYYPLLHCRV